MELLWIIIIALLGFIFRLFQVFSVPETPKLFYKKTCSPFIEAVLKACPTFFSVYKPTVLWGKSGHFQTIIHVKMGRTMPRWPDGQRFHIPMPDGATMSYDLFDPHKEGYRAKFTLALCPGIANSSECIYLRTFASYAQLHGFRVAILNHLGALKSETLTSPRVFTYGGTDEYGRMVDHLLEQYPDTKILAVGFSMGANIVTKYLGENFDNQKKVLCGMSVCQGYEINEASSYFMNWENCRRIYTYVMTLKQLKLLSRHRKYLFNEEATQKWQCCQFKEDNVFKATSLAEIDENYTCIRLGYKSPVEYYDEHSSAHCLKNIRIPMLFMNAEDDPLVPPPLFKHPKQFAENNDNCIFMTTKHGGHLGYFEGGLFVPDNVTWLDRVIIDYADAVTHLYLEGKLPQQTGSKSTSQNEDLQKPDDLDLIADSETADLSMIGKSSSCLEASGLKMSPTSKDDPSELQDGEKRDSLKRGSLLKQATSYVQ